MHKSKKKSKEEKVKRKLDFKRAMPKVEEMETLGENQVDQGDYSLFEVDPIKIPVSVFDEISMYFLFIP